MDVKALAWVERALGECGGPDMGIEGYGGYRGPQMGVNGLG